MLIATFCSADLGQFFFYFGPANFRKIARTFLSEFLHIHVQSCRHASTISQRETKGRFCKRVVLANVPSFRFLVPSFLFLYPLFQFLVPSFRFLYPQAGFWYRGTSVKTTLLETTLVRTPECPFSREYGDSRDSPECGKQGRIQSFSRDSREVRGF